MAWRVYAKAKTTTRSLRKATTSLIRLTDKAFSIIVRAHWDGHGGLIGLAVAEAFPVSWWNGNAELSKENV